MSVAVALEADVGGRRRVVLGTDAILGETGTCVSLPGKLFRLGAVGVAWCGSLRVAQLVAHTVTIAKRAPREDDLTYVLRGVVEPIRAALTRASATVARDGDRMADGSTLLLAVRGRAWCVQDDFSVIPATAGYLAAGAGEGHALAALAATEGLDLAPEERVRRAVRAAALHCPAVRLPDHVEVFP